MKLGDKLKQTFEQLKQANITRLEDQHNADLAKIKHERDDITHWLETIKKLFVEQINSGKVPLKKITSYERKSWIESATKGKAKHQDLWRSFEQFWRSEGLEIVVKHDHDGVGIKSWINLTLEVLPARPRGMSNVDIGVYDG